MIHYVPAGANLQAYLDNATAGDELNLADGTYTGGGSTVLSIDKDITLRANHSGMAVLDGEFQRRVASITGGAVQLDGLVIWRGSASTSAPGVRLV